MTHLGHFRRTIALSLYQADPLRCWPSGVWGAGMRRREFFRVIGGVAAAWPLVAAAQQPTPVVGFLRTGSLAATPNLIEAFRQGLKEAGFAEGQDVTIEFRSAEGRSERLPQLAAELVRGPASVLIVAIGGTASVVAAKAASTSLPIVFAKRRRSSPGIGLVPSSNRPGGNVTGVSFFVTAPWRQAARIATALCECREDCGACVSEHNSDRGRTIGSANCGASRGAAADHC